MTNEEKKAVDYWKNYMKILHWNTQLASEYYMKVLLDLIEKQNKNIKELESDKEIKDKMIDLMTNLIYNWDAFRNYGSRKNIKQYFENKAKVNLQSNKEKTDTQDFKQKYQCEWNLKSNEESGEIDEDNRIIE